MMAALLKMGMSIAAAWEGLNGRDYLHAGPSKGSDVAAWKQAAQAELSSTCKDARYAQCLLDLVNACVRIPHHVLVREASGL